MTSRSEGPWASRRQLMAWSAGAVAAAGPARLLAQSGESFRLGPVVETSNGKVQGHIADGVHRFRGLRYGASTAGANRFKPPVRPEKWAGVAESYVAVGGPTAPQPDTPLGAPLPGAFVPKTPMSEDCLNLNVFTRGLDDAGKRPVMVWLHGGAWRQGAGAEPITDGTRLAGRNDVVVVTINHRINLFGYMYLTEALGPDYADSSNVGVLDILLALRWVKDNISRFGGDPGNVTLFGQSAGGSEISQIVSMPSAAGLFHKIIIQSGATLTLRNPEVAARATDQVLTSLGLSRATADRLLTMPMGEILKVAGRGFGPTVDGRSTPRHPWDPDSPPLMKAVPMMIGGTDMEMTFGARDAAFALDEATLRRQVANGLGDEADAFLAAFREGRQDATPADINFLISTGLWVTKRVIRQAERTVHQGGAPVYVYRWEWKAPNRYKSVHCVDIPFVWDNVGLVPEMVGSGPALQQLADKVSRRWVAFARSGVPDIPGQPAWPAYDTTRRATLVIDSVDKVVDDPRPAERVALMRLPDSLMRLPDSPSENVGVPR